MKRRIVEITFESGETKYFIQEKWLFWWRDLTKEFFRTSSLTHYYNNYYDAESALLSRKTFSKKVVYVQNEKT